MDSSLTQKIILFSLLGVSSFGGLVPDASAAWQPMQELAVSAQDLEDLPVVKEPLSRTETLLDTACQLQIYHEGQEDVLEAGFAYIREMEDLMSSHVSGSDVDRINKAAGDHPVQVDPETYKVIERGLELGAATDGLYDITIGALTDLWRIGSMDARKPSQEEIDEALPLIDYRAVQLNPEDHSVYLEKAGMQLELGSIAKGYIADGVGEVFRSHNISSAIINLGGNVVVIGTSPNSSEGWKVGVQDPDELRGNVIGAKRVIDGSVVTSGIYERYVEVDGKKYHHILDPFTGYPVESQVTSVTIFSPESMDGDALSTALFLFGREKGMDFIEGLDQVDAVFVDEDHQVYLTQGLEDDFELTNEEYTLIDN